MASHPLVRRKDVPIKDYTRYAEKKQAFFQKTGRKKGHSQIVTSKAGFPEGSPLGIGRLLIGSVYIEPALDEQAAFHKYTECVLPRGYIAQIIIHKLKEISANKIVRVRSL